MTKPLEIKSNKVTKSFKNIIPLTFGEEIGNAVSHGVAAFVTLCALLYAAIQRYFAHGILGSFSVSIYVISIFLMFLSSTVYHTMPNHSSHKYILRIIDHSIIYISTAVIYT